MPVKSTSQSARVRIRSANWTDSLDAILLRLLREQHLLGNCTEGQVKTEAWLGIIPAFNEQSGVSMAKNHLQNRLKVLKNTFYLYSALASRSGWGWDYVLNKPKPESSSDWETAIVANPKYAKCRDKQFQAYKDLEVLCGKKTALDDDDDDSGDDTAVACSTDIDVRDMTVANLSSGVPTSSKVIRPPTEAELTSLDSPSAMPTRVTPMSSSPNPSNPRTPLNECPIDGHEAPPRKRQRCSSSAPCTCKIMPSGDTEALSELVEIGRQFLEIAREFLSRDVDSRPPKVYSMEDCIEKLNGLQGLSDEAMLAVLDAFKDTDNRSIFIGLNGSLLSAWIGRLVAIRSEPRVVVDK